ncbi:PP2C family protein-serine/threonine phosphatase [Butyrivibrio sp. AE2032]|jgi:sigma-B regulation protein RsbU (phosphoserine phosphatase)|uniref:PP2C family protein-serine/threonine phosphatase n=1 Tax=Butyrivibrio sp. AE2032 TaxID=1458463 RepID=UPI00068C6867|nr:PP2C family protein-serine/threonine phosphatase [Butyrivibrio sp. AE2032]
MKKMSLGQKSVLLVIIMVVVMGLVEGVLTYVVFDKTINSEYEKNVTNLAHTVAVSVDGDNIGLLRDKVVEVYESLDKKVGSDMMGTPEFDEYISHYQGIKETPEFKTELKKLQRISEANGVDIYVVYVYPKEKITFYLADGSEIANDPGVYDPLYEVNYAVLDDPSIGYPAYITNTPEYGWLVTAGYPIYDSKGEVVALGLADISMNDIKSKETAFTWLLAGLTLLIAVVLSSIFILLIKQQVVSPINKLSKAALNYYSTEKGHAFSGLNITTGDEIENLSDAMKHMEQDINEYVDNITAITAEKERIGAELNVATQIQADMLPRIFPSFPEKTEFDLYASMDPAKEVGGDFYDFFLIDESHLGLVVADVSGKGVPAALFMVIAKTLIKNRALIGGTPSEILSYANEQLCEGNDAELFVTVWFAILDIKTGKGLAANAGHEHPALKRADGTFELVMYKHSPALATMEGLKFKEHEFELHHGDTLLCYTDGVTEATNKDNVLFGNDRLLEALNKEPNADVYGVVNNVKTAIDEFVAEAPQFDDITMLCIHYN